MGLPIGGNGEAFANLRLGQIKKNTWLASHSHKFLLILKFFNSIFFGGGDGAVFPPYRRNFFTDVAKAAILL
jgi:hypothetical protein